MTLKFTISDKYAVAVKVPKIKDFYKVFFCIKAILST